jgi:ABC-type uncharacterized transport system permease subunit
VSTNSTTRPGIVLTFAILSFTDFTTTSTTVKVASDVGSSVQANLIECENNSFVGRIAQNSLQGNDSGSTGRYFSDTLGSLCE